MADRWSRFRKNLTTLIERAGSVEKLAVACDLSYWTVMHWRDGTRHPTVSSLDKLAKGTKRAVDTLLHGDV